ncbi:uncharacterized protein PSFLO_03240 [Pseudozyma flocculosa]|uniref:Uncharacterized protein n=1 Tax=Pseudozyma flocculosa TaxID=84751 RepID=A0A5C3EZR4_9BASI|nr:uncharacterized protein PSFLO_03240 [Pseudozyma flocculosa]
MTTGSTSSSPSIRVATPSSKISKAAVRTGLLAGLQAEEGWRRAGRRMRSARGDERMARRGPPPLGSRTRAEISLDQPFVWLCPGPSPSTSCIIHLFWICKEAIPSVPGINSRTEQRQAGLQRRIHTTVSYNATSRPGPRLALADEVTDTGQSVGPAPSKSDHRSSPYPSHGTGRFVVSLTRQDRGPSSGPRWSGTPCACPSAGSRVQYAHISLPLSGPSRGDSSDRVRLKVTAACTYVQRPQSGLSDVWLLSGYGGAAELHAARASEGTSVRVCCMQATPKCGEAVATMPTEDNGRQVGRSKDGPAQAAGRRQQAAGQKWPTPADTTSTGSAPPSQPTLSGPVAAISPPSLAGPACFIRQRRSAKQQQHRTNAVEIVNDPGVEPLTTTQHLPIAKSYYMSTSSQIGSGKSRRFVANETLLPAADDPYHPKSPGCPFSFGRNEPILIVRPPRSRSSEGRCSSNEHIDKQAMTIRRLAWLYRASSSSLAQRNVHAACFFSFDAQTSRSRDRQTSRSRSRLNFDVSRAHPTGKRWEFYEITVLREEPAKPRRELTATAANQPQHVPAVRSGLDSTSQTRDLLQTASLSRHLLLKGGANLPPSAYFKIGPPRAQTLVGHPATWLLRSHLLTASPT